jgi:hypothetical protein
LETMGRNEMHINFDKHDKVVDVVVFGPNLP